MFPSFNSIKTFFSLNSILVTLSCLEMYLFSSSSQSFSLPFIIARNICLVKFIECSIQSRPLITPRETENKLDFYVKLVHSSIIETFTIQLTRKLFTFNNNNLATDLVYFIPLSFVFEILFDFGHYCSHRLLHSKYLYKYIHKTHHKYKEPLPILAFYHHPLDLILTNSIPFLVVTYVLHNHISYLQLHLILVYKTFLEISGHCGRKTNSSCFTQCVWLPRALEIELLVDDHDRHHSKTNCNYSKRFSIWDKTFGTYESN